MDGLFSELSISEKSLLTHEIMNCLILRGSEVTLNGGQCIWRHMCGVMTIRVLLTDLAAPEVVTSCSKAGRQLPVSNGFSLRWSPTILSSCIHALEELYT